MIVCLRERARRLGWMVAAGLVLTSVASCGGGQPAPGPDRVPRPIGTVANGCDLPTGPVAIAYGARANTPEPRLPGRVEDLLSRGVAEQQTIAAIRVDGEPVPAFSATFQPTAKNDRALKDERDRFLTAVHKEFDNVRAKKPEADTLAALSLAARSVREGGGTVVLADSGLQTTAPLDFRDAALLGSKPDEVTTFLDKSRLLPDLKGVTVALVGIGNTVGPQATLDQFNHDNLIEIWRAIAKAAGARCVAVFDEPGPTKPRSGALPAVTPVALPPKPTLMPCGQTVLPNSGKVGFRPDEAVFVDPAAARAALAEMAPTMIRGNQRVELIGTTASDGPREGRIELSRRRAEAVKQILVELRVPADRITARGVGSEWEGHKTDLDGNGVLLPGPAAENRSVVVRLSCPPGGAP